MNLLAPFAGRAQRPRPTPPGRRFLRSPRADESGAVRLPLMDAARRGDEGAFRQLVDPLRGELHAHCYRMLGSAHDAEDATQDVMLRAWRGLARYEGRASLRSWLYRIATNVCLDAIERRPKRVVPLDPGSAANRDEEAPLQPSPEDDQAAGAAGIEAYYEH